MKKKFYRQNRPVIITIKRLGINGEGIGYYKKKIIFIPGALPAEVVVAKITARHSNYLEGRLIRIKSKSPARVPFPKGADPEIGGLELAHLSYEGQLRYKRANMVEALKKFHPEGYRKYKVKKTIPAPQQWHYRTKAQYQIESRRGKLLLGLYSPHSRRLIDAPVMPTQSKATQKTERKIKRLVQDLHVDIDRYRRRRAGLKTIVVRASHSNGEIQVTFITTGKNVNNLPELAKRTSKLKDVVSVYENVTDWNNPQIWGNRTFKLAGKDSLTEEILGKKFLLSPRAFFQLNPGQTSQLYSTAIKYLDLKPSDTLVDAYCGVGTIGIIASSQVKRVIGIESVPDAARDANRNAALNQAKNFSCLQGRVEKILPALREQGVPLDALIVDPPRTGLAKSLIKTLLRVKPRTFVYISCNPSTLAQDLVLLSEKYKVRLIQNIDMMPQTPRCEAICKLVLK